MGSHHWNFDYGGWPLGSRHCCCHSNRTWFTITFVPMDKKLLFYWCLNYITVCLPSPRRSYPMVFMHTVQCSHFLIERHSVWNSLQFFQWLVMLQCSGQSYGSSVSQLIESEAVVRYKHTTTNKFNVSVAMAMIAPHHQSSHWYCFIVHMAIEIVVAIATEHGFAALLVFRNLTFLLLLHWQLNIISRREHGISI